MEPELIQREGADDIRSCESHEQAKEGESGLSFRMIEQYWRNYHEDRSADYCPHGYCRLVFTDGEDLVMHRV